MYDFPAPPERVIKRDGRVVPFEADKISRALFAAGESVGRPDAFLARELTDGVLHFLAAEGDGGVPTTAQVGEQVAKAVRELGQPALAQAFAEHGRLRVRGQTRPVPAGGEVVLRFPPGMAPEAVLAACTRSYTLQGVFARDLVAAQADGLLTLTGLEHPERLEGLVLGSVSGAGGGPAEAVEAARGPAGRFVALDGPEYDPAGEESDAREFARNLSVGLRLAGLTAVVNLNAASPPPRAGELGGGPLFPGPSGGVSPERRSALADAMFDALLHAGPDRVRIDWHVGPSDCAPEARGRLERLARAALDGAPVAFAFDRPKRPVALAEGVDRGTPGVMLTVGLHLPRLASRDDAGNPERFLRKLTSLARLALSAGVQKRAFLRQRERLRAEARPIGPAVSTGFLLDRARLVVAPVGLDEVVRTFTGDGLASGGPALEFGKQIVTRLRDVLTQDGRQTALETCLDGPTSFALAGEVTAPARVAGLTPWGPAAVRDQLRAAGALHAVAGCGTLAAFVPDDDPPSAAAAADWLLLAWQRSDVVRLRFAR
jgi:hypothetical protein